MTCVKLREANIQNVKHQMKAIWHTYVQGIALMKFKMHIIVFIVSCIVFKQEVLLCGVTPVKHQHFITRQVNDLFPPLHYSLPLVWYLSRKCCCVAV